MKWRREAWWVSKGIKEHRIIKKNTTIWPGFGDLQKAQLKHRLFFKSQLDKFINLSPLALRCKLTNVKLGDLSVETQSAPACPCRPPTSHCCVCTATLVRLWWLFYLFYYYYYFRHEYQSMTCAQQRQADDEPTPIGRRPASRLMCRNMRAAWVITGAQVAPHLMSHIHMQFLHAHASNKHFPDTSTLHLKEFLIKINILFYQRQKKSRLLNLSKFSIHSTPRNILVTLSDSAVSNSSKLLNIYTKCHHIFIYFRNSLCWNPYMDSLHTERSISTFISVHI